MINFCNNDYVGIGFVTFLLMIVLFIIFYIIKNIIEYIKDNNKFEKIKTALNNLKELLFAAVASVLIVFILYGVLYILGWIVSKILCS